VGYFHFEQCFIQEYLEWVEQEELRKEKGLQDVVLFCFYCISSGSSFGGSNGILVVSYL
jgi:hypothetical protein